MQRIARRRLQGAPRRRRYVSPLLLTVLRPLLRYSYGRSAYVLRLVGESHGPVLRQDRRRRQREYEGPDQRGAFVGSGGPHVIAGP